MYLRLDRLDSGEGSSARLGKWGPQQDCKQAEDEEADLGTTEGHSHRIDGAKQITDRQLSGCAQTE